MMTRTGALTLSIALVLATLANTARAQDTTAEPPVDAPAPTPSAAPADAPVPAPGAPAVRDEDETERPTPAETPPPPPPPSGGGPASGGGTSALSAVADRTPGGFTFGGYGRVSAASDLNGRLGRNADLVSRSPRLDEGTYAELELRYRNRFETMDTIIVATLGIVGPLFHFDGNFGEQIAVRNLFAEVVNAGVRGLALWAGSRMVRGDDVYLLDFWPLDNLNMVGGGARYAIDDRAEVALHGGLAQPNDPFFRQLVGVPSTYLFTPQPTAYLDRPRLFAAVKATYWPMGRFERQGLKLILYAEGHTLPAGSRREDDMTTRTLPEENGVLVGAEVGGWFADHNAFLNAFFRYARGIAAINPLASPFTVGEIRPLSNTEEVLIATSGNFEWDFVGVQLGAYWRRYSDPGTTLFQGTLLGEGAVVVRPHVWLGNNVGISADVSYQEILTTSVDDRTGQLRGGSAWKLGLMPYFSPFGRGTYTRPHLRLLYSVTLRDSRSVTMYNNLDPAHTQTTEHFLGIGVEWWFNSSYL